MSDTTADGWVQDTFGVDPASYQPAAVAQPAAAEAAAPGGFFSSIGDAISSAASSVADVASDVGSSVASAAGSVADTVSDVASTVADAVSDVAGSVADTVSDVAGSVAETASDIAGGIGDAVSGAIHAIGELISPDAPPPPVLIPAQQARADAALDKMPPADQEKYKALAEKAGSEKEKQYLAKGLAAGHSVAELEAFQAKLAGKDATWLQDNLSLTGDSHGKGVKQQWSMSCNATTVEAVHGEMDPLYALKMHEDNPKLSEADDSDGMKDNPNLAADQKAMLETANPDGSQGGIAHARTGDTNPRGRWNTDLLNGIKDVTGVEYTNQKIGTDVTIDAGVESMNTNLASGTPVPIVVGDGGVNTYAHYVLVTASDPGPPRTYTIHDPAKGETVTRTEKQLRDGTLDAGGWNKISAFETPTPVKVK